MLLGGFTVTLAITLSGDVTGQGLSLHKFAGCLLPPPAVGKLSFSHSPKIARNRQLTQVTCGLALRRATRGGFEYSLSFSIISGSTPLDESGINLNHHSNQQHGRGPGQQEPQQTTAIYPFLRLVTDGSGSAQEEAYSILPYR